MYNRNGVDTYRDTDAHTMTREKLVVLLYEKIVTNLHGAEKAAAEGKRLAMTQMLNHSQQIISELRNALDHEIGGEISRNLESLYDFMFQEHLEMLVNRNPVHARNCLQVITPLLEAWRRIPVGTGEQAARDLVRTAGHPEGGPNHATQETKQGAVSAPGPLAAEGTPQSISELVSVSA